MIGQAAAKKVGGVGPKMDEDEDCCICLGGQQGDFLALPGCGHRMHVACTLQLAQVAPLRCPVCRNEPIPVVESAVVTTQPVSLEEYVRERRQLMATSRRFVRSRPRLADILGRLRRLRQEMSAQARQGQRVYDEKCREIYAHDAEVQAVRKNLRNMRRRELRLTRCLQREVEAALEEESA